MTEQTPLIKLYMQELEALKDTPPVPMYIEKLAAIAIITNIQLALRYPGNNNWSAEQGKAIALQLQQLFPTDSAIYKVIEMGFNTIFDSPYIQCSETTQSAEEISELLKTSVRSDLEDIGWEIIDEAEDL